MGFLPNVFLLFIVVAYGVGGTAIALMAMGFPGPVTQVCDGVKHSNSLYLTMDYVHDLTDIERIKVNTK